MIGYEHTGAAKPEQVVLVRSGVFSAVIVEREEGNIASTIGAKSLSVFGKRDNVLGADHGRRRVTIKDTVDVGIVLGTAQWARSAQTMQSRVSREVSVKVVSQLVQVLLFHKRSFNNGRWGTGEINPAKITAYGAQML